MADRVKLKYPIVFVHGVAATERSLLINFWGRIPRYLANFGIKVHYGNTDSWAGYKTNAPMLIKSLNKILERTGRGKVNIIAHSKGGIDARYVISSCGFHDKVASLTTLCTPHLGSELSDYVFERNYVNNRFAKVLMSLLGILYGDNNPDPKELLRELKTDNMRKFNERNPNVDDIFYQSYYTKLKNGFDDLNYYTSYMVLHRLAGDNDGIISNRSTKWGEVHELIDGKTNGISHAEIVDFYQKKISGVHIPEIYLDIIKDLSRRGF